MRSESKGKDREGKQGETGNGKSKERRAGGGEIVGGSMIGIEG